MKYELNTTSWNDTLLTQVNWNKPTEDIIRELENGGVGPSEVYILTKPYDYIKEEITVLVIDENSTKRHVFKTSWSNEFDEKVYDKLRTFLNGCLDQDNIEFYEKILGISPVEKVFIVSTTFNEIPRYNYSNYISEVSLKHELVKDIKRIMSSNMTEDDKVIQICKSIYGTGETYETRLDNTTLVLLEDIVIGLGK